jgi:hypothetical protein
MNKISETAKDWALYIAMAFLLGIVLIGLFVMLTDTAYNQEKKKIKYVQGMQILITKETKFIGYMDSTSRLYILDSLEYGD